MSAGTQGRIKAGVVPITIGGVQQNFFVVGIPETTKVVAITGLVSDAEKHDESIADAARLAACWNVCEGLDTDYIEYAARTNNFVGAVQWLTVECDGLKAELKTTQESRDHYQRCYHEASNHIRDCTDADQLKAAQAINAELLAALEHVLNVIPGGGFAQIHHGSDTYAQILAAVDKAKGGAESSPHSNDYVATTKEEAEAILDKIISKGTS